MEDYYHDSKTLLLRAVELKKRAEILYEEMNNCIGGLIYWNDASKVSPPEPGCDYDLERPKDKDELETWLDENFERYMVAINDAKEAAILYYIGDDAWVDEKGISYNVRCWMFLPDVPGDDIGEEVSRRG